MHFYRRGALASNFIRLKTSQQGSKCHISLWAGPYNFNGGPQLPISLLTPNLKEVGLASNIIQHAFINICVFFTFDYYVKGPLRVPLSIGKSPVVTGDVGKHLGIT